jgi:predicted phage terminase large subunit-like protein
MDQDLILAELARRDFKVFVRLFWPVVEPATPFQAGWYIDAICEHLTYLAKPDTYELRNLLVNIAPRHGKSILASVMFPAWVWTFRPSARFICASYSQDLSTEFSLKCRRIIESDLYQKAYGHRFQLTTDQNQKTRFENDQTGARQAVSVGSATIGFGADYVICDDPNNVKKVYSETDREAVIVWWREVLSTRLNNPATACRVVCQARCHERDLSGWIIDNDKLNDWCKLILPFEYDGNSAPNKTGWRDPRTQPGEYLSGLLTPDAVRSKKQEMGSSGWATQYNQRPAPAEGNVFLKDWFRRYDETETAYRLGGRVIDKAACWRFAVVDLAVSTRATADWTVCQVWDVTPTADMVLVHQFRERVDGAKILPTLEGLYKVYQPDFIGIEDVAFQRLVIQQAKLAGLTVKHLKPEADKLTRSIPAQIKAENGQVWLPQDRPWLADLEHELLHFPNSAHDDQVDCFAYAAIMVSRRYGNRPAEPVPEQRPEDREERLWQELVMLGTD